MTNSVNNSTAANPDLSQPDPDTRKSLGQQDFLRLMVAQVQNQNLMQPQPNDEVLSQLAQFNTSAGITKMQDSLQQMASSLQSNQALQASVLVGRKVLVNSDKLNLDHEGDVKTVIDMPAGLNEIIVSIYSDSGELVKTIALEQPTPGFYQFSWDGKGQNEQRLPAANYTVKVKAHSGDEEIALETLTTANVDSVSLGQNGDGLKLNVAGVGSLSLDQVRQISV